MSQRLPIASQMSWLALIPQFIVLALAVGGGYLLIPSPKGVMLGAAVGLLYSRGSRFILCADHHRGARLLQAGQYDDAIAAFQASYGFFSRHA